MIAPEQKDERELVNCVVIILDAYDLCYPILKDLITKEVEGTSTFISATPTPLADRSTQAILLR